MTAKEHIDYFCARRVPVERGFPVAAMEDRVLSYVARRGLTHDVAILIMRAAYTLYYTQKDTPK